jgi:hypothetical protein
MHASNVHRTILPKLCLVILLTDCDHESADEFVDCSEGGADDDVFELLDRISASDGFVSVTP